MRTCFKYFFLFTGIASTDHAVAQNLVPNPSFEDFAACPYTLGEITQASNWFTFRGTCDYFNGCDQDTVGVPENWFGYQSAATGVAYAGIYCFSEDDGNPLQAREWLGTELTTPLIPGARYYVSFKASLTTGGFGTNGSFIYAVSHLGALLSNTAFFQTDLDAVPNFADVYTQSILQDSMDWSLIHGTFIADSAYAYLVIGNFFDDTMTNALEVFPGGLYQYAYYYIDDVCLSMDSTTCAGINSMPRWLGNPMRTHPNPFADLVMVDLPGVGTAAYRVEITDVLGRLVSCAVLNATEGLVIRFAADLASGTYVLNVMLEDGMKHCSLLQHSQ